MYKKETIFFSKIKLSLMDLPSPSNMNYFWNFGSLLGLVLLFQILTGMFLAMHYNADVSLSFFSMNHMSSDVAYGFFIKNFHSNGASIFFMCVYIHMGSGLYNGSYFSIFVWNIGMMIFLLMMMMSFMGYVLPWGQMSFWGATVITNFVSAIPYMGVTMVEWMWGGFSVGNPTLNRFFSLHYLLPFMLVSLVLLHMIFLHENGSNNSTGLNSDMDKIRFHIYFTVKDLFGFMILFIFLFYLLFFMPYYLGDPENFMKANSVLTPIHIMPEWYFLFAYAILRAIPNKMGGVVCLLLSVLILFILPFVHTNKQKSLLFSPISKMAYWFFIFLFMLLTWMGSKPVVEPYMFIGQLSSFFYFFYFIMVIPLVGLMENLLKY